MVTRQIRALRLFYIYECTEETGEPAVLLHTGRYYSGPDAVNRWLHSYQRSNGAGESYRRLRNLQRRGLLVGLAESVSPPKPADRLPVRVVITAPAAATVPAKKEPAKQLGLF